MGAVGAPRVRACVRAQMVAGVVLQEQYDSIVRVQRKGLISQMDAAELLAPVKHDLQKMEVRVTMTYI